MTRIWKRYRDESAFLRQYWWKYRKLVGVGLLALVIVDVLEVLPPIFLKYAIDIVIEKKPINYLLAVAGAYLGTALLQSVCRYGWRMFLVRSSMLAGRDIRQGFAGHLFGLSTSFFDKRRIGDLMSHAVSDVDAVRMALGPGLLTLADALFYFITVPIAMFLLSPKLAILALLPLPIIPWIVWRNEREIHERFERVQESNSSLSAAAQETLGGIRVIKAFAREDARLAQFRATGEEYIRLNMRLARVQSAFGPTLDTIMSLGLVLLIYIGGTGVISEAVTLGTFVAFQRYIQKMAWPMAAIGFAISYYQRAIASSGRLLAVQAIPTDVPEPAEPKLPAGFVAGGRTSGRIEFRNLTFRFPGTQKDVLKNISFMVQPGERVALVGPIGAGKSALLSLVPRLYPVSRGMLFVDGVDVNDWPIEELRRQVGYVSQEVFLFSESVLENLAYGFAGARTGEVQVSAVETGTRLASVHDEVLGMPLGFSTRLGERGVNVSGGQKQRLTIARAILKEPPVLILDDALSAIDVQTEEKILRGLRARPGRNTELIAAHRVSTIRDSDKIVVLENGVIQRIGRHSELIAASGIYQRFYEQQRLQEDLEQYVETVLH